MKLLSKIWVRVTQMKPAVYGWIYFVTIPVFAVVYFFVQGFKDDHLYFLDSLYFSAVTITTLGYGDIQPSLLCTRLIAASEAVIGVLMIGLFLSALSHSRSESQAKEEVDRQEQRNRSLAETGVSKHCLMLMPLIEDYLRGVNLISAEKKDRSAGFVENFAISNFAEIFNPASLQRESFSLPKIVIYLEFQLGLKKELERFLVSVDLSYWPELRDAVSDWLLNFRWYDYSNSILSIPNMRVGDKAMIDADRKMLEKFDGEVKIQGSNAMDPYCALYLQLHKLHAITQNIKSELLEISN